MAITKAPTIPPTTSISSGSSVCASVSASSCVCRSYHCANLSSKTSSEPDSSPTRTSCRHSGGNSGCRARGVMKRLAFGELPLYLLQRLSVQQMVGRERRRVQPFHQRQPRALGHGQNTKGLIQRAAAHQPGDQRQAQQGGSVIGATAGADAASGNSRTAMRRAAAPNRGQRRSAARTTLITRG